MRKIQKKTIPYNKFHLTGKHDIIKSSIVAGIFKKHFFITKIHMRKKYPNHLNSSLMGYDSTNPLVRFYFRRILGTIIEMLKDVPRENLILDFGCGEQHLKKILSDKYNVVGYDIISEFSDVKDYRHLKPKVILCNHVLEHLSVQELRETLDNFKKMSPQFIITAIPTENIVSKLGVILFGTSGHFGHKTRINLIHAELNNRFQLVKKRSIFALTIVSKWRVSTDLSKEPKCLHCQILRDTILEKAARRFF